MLSRVYTKIFDFAKTKPVKLWAYTWLAAIIVAFVFVLGGAVPLFGFAASILMSTSVLVLSLKSIRGEEFTVSNLFDNCKSWKSVWRIIGGNLWAMLFIFLWGLIPIAGPFIAIVRAYEYRLVPYILVFEPDVSITDARLVSKERTSGYKWDMFSCDIVWVCAFIFAVAILGLLSHIPFIGELFGFVNFLLILAVIAFAFILSNLINAECYEEINNARNTAAGAPQENV